MLLFGLVLLVLATAASAGIVVLDIQRRDDLDFARHDRSRLGRRQLSQTLDNLDRLYFANITLGTPPQNLRMHIDTGSSDLWCNSPQSSFCSSQLRRCVDSGTYDSTASSTYQFLNDGFNISYLDGSGAYGDYVTDSIGIGGQTLPNFQFGVGLRSSSTEGVLGIGYAINEAQVRRGKDDPYANLPQLLVDNGLIKSNAYSLWLNDLDASTGQIVFGGVNTDKFRGSLQTLPVLKAEGQYTELSIALGSISVDGVNIASPSLPAAVLLDSGSTLMYLPNTITRSIYTQLQAVTDQRSGSTVAYVSCALAKLDKYIDFTFSGVKISVPFNEVVLPSTRPGGSNLHFEDGTPACLFGIAPSEGGTNVLGDTFLRSAYVVYDLANNQISLGQTNFNSTSDNIKEIQAGPGGVPDATMVADPIIDAKGMVMATASLTTWAPPTGTTVSGSSTEAAVPAVVWSVLVALLATLFSA